MGSFPETYKDSKLPPIVNLTKLRRHDAAWPYILDVDCRSTFSSPKAGAVRCLFVLFFLV